MTQFDKKFLKASVELARKCSPVATAFSVGAIIVSTSGEELSTGFSRELGATWHAEEVAIHKAQQAGCDLKSACIYSSLEPCGERLSGKETCSSHIINSGIKRVVYAWKEPKLFVEPKGVQTLKAAGIEVLHLTGFEDLVREVNSHLMFEYYK